MTKFLYAPLLALAFLVTGCSPSAAPTPSPAPTPSTNSAPVSPTAPTAFDATPYLPFIQTGASVATGAALQFGITDTAQRTKVANEIYASGAAIYSLCTGAVPTPAVLSSTILAFGGTQADASYANYASAVTALYSTYYTKLNGDPKQAVAVLSALAAGAENGASAYATVTPVTSPTPTTSLIPLIPVPATNNTTTVNAN